MLSQHWSNPRSDINSICDISFLFPFFTLRQEELQDFEVNPDVPTMRLYRCWDSKALISEDSQSRSITTEQRGEVTADQAAILMYRTQLL